MCCDEKDILCAQVFAVAWFQTVQLGGHPQPRLADSTTRSTCHWIHGKPLS